MRSALVTSERRMKQAVIFDGLVYGTIWPTDIDGFLDFQNRLFIIIEVKCAGVPFKSGQSLSFERLAQASRVPTVILLARHSVPSHDDIYLANCSVTHVYRGPRWQWVEQEPAMVRQHIDALRLEFGLETERPKMLLRDAFATGGHCRVHTLVALEANGSCYVCDHGS